MICHAACVAECNTQQELHHFHRRCPPRGALDHGAYPCADARVHDGRIGLRVRTPRPPECHAVREDQRRCAISANDGTQGRRSSVQVLGGRCTFVCCARDGISDGLRGWERARGKEVGTEGQLTLTVREPLPCPSGCAQIAGTSTTRIFSVGGILRNRLSGSSAPSALARVVVTRKWWATPLASRLTVVMDRSSSGVVLGLS